eukprot:m.261153 g.261153  ORF g.261153 m.261153 type:complete len:1838 (-) comp17594_c0_seq1:70-5583(-)
MLAAILALTLCALLPSTAGVASKYDVVLPPTIDNSITVSKGSAVHVPANVTITTTGVLTLERGCIVSLAKGVYIHAQGVLQFQGTIANPIFMLFDQSSVTSSVASLFAAKGLSGFTNPVETADSRWGGIIVTPTSAAMNQLRRLRHTVMANFASVIIESAPFPIVGLKGFDAGGDPQALVPAISIQSPPDTTAAWELVDIQVHTSAWHGLHVQGDTLQRGFSLLTGSFRGNQGYGVSLAASGGVATKPNIIKNVQFSDANGGVLCHIIQSSITLPSPKLVAYPVILDDVTMTQVSKPIAADRTAIAVTNSIIASCAAGSQALVSTIGTSSHLLIEHTQFARNAGPQLDSGAQYTILYDVAFADVEASGSALLNVDAPVLPIGVTLSDIYIHSCTAEQLMVSQSNLLTFEGLTVYNSNVTATMFELHTKGAMSIFDLAMSSCTVSNTALDLSGAGQTADGKPAVSAQLSRWSILSDNTLPSEWLKVQLLSVTLQDSYLKGPALSDVDGVNPVNAATRPWYTQIPAMAGLARGVVFGRVRNGDSMTLPTQTEWDVIATLEAPTGTSLTIEEGCTLHMAAETSLVVGGALSMEARTSAPIVLKQRDTVASGAYMGCIYPEGIAEKEGVSTWTECLSACQTDKAMEMLFRASPSFCACPSAEAATDTSTLGQITEDVCRGLSHASVYAVVANRPWGAVQLNPTSDATDKITMVNVQLIQGGWTADAQACLEVARPGLDLSFVDVTGCLKAGVGVSATHLKLRNSKVMNSTGAGVFVPSGGCMQSCILTDITVRHNQDNGISWSASEIAHLVLHNAMVEQNSLMASLGGIQATCETSTSSLTITASTIRDNGGGGLLANHCLVSVSGTTIAQELESVATFTTLSVSRSDLFELSDSKLLGGIPSLMLLNAQNASINRLQASTPSGVSVLSLMHENPGYQTAYLTMDSIAITGSTVEHAILIKADTTDLHCDLSRFRVHANKLHQALWIRVKDAQLFQLADSVVEGSDSLYGSDNVASHQLSAALRFVSESRLYTTAPIILTNVVLDNPLLSNEMRVGTHVVTAMQFPTKIAATQLYVSQDSRVFSIRDGDLATIDFTFRSRSTKTFSCSDLNDCNGNGVCVVPNVCVCSAGYLAPTCSLQPCDDGFKRRTENGPCLKVCGAIGDWPEALAGDTVSISCSMTQTGVRSRDCTATGYGQSNTKACRSQALQTARDRMKNEGVFTTNIMSEWAHEVKAVDQAMGTDDVAACIDTLNDAVAQLTSIDAEVDLDDLVAQTAEVLNVIVQVGASTLSEGRDESEAKIPMNRLFEKFSDAVSERLPPNGRVNATRGSAVLRFARNGLSLLQSQGIEPLQDALAEVNSNFSVKLSPELFTKFAADIDGAVSSIWYRDDNMFDSNATVQSSYVFSVRVPGLPENNSDLGVSAIELQFPKPSEGEARCTFWDFSAAEWSDSGCTTKEDENVVTCVCTHLTNFASIVTLQPAGDGGDGDGGPSPLSETDARNLSIITYVGVSISVLALTILTVALLTAWRRLRVYQRLIVFLAPVMIATQLLFILAAGKDPADDNSLYQVSDSCRLIAGSLHFLVLMTFALFLCEAVELYFNFVIVFSDTVTEQARLRNYIVLSLLVSGILVLVGGMGFSDDYGTADYCWLKRESTASYLLWVPMGVAVIFNIVLMVITLKKISVTDDEINVRVLVIGGLSFSTLLGLGWAAGLLAVALDSVVLQYVFAILTTFQGLLIFIFYFIRDPGFRRYTYVMWCGSAADRRRISRRSTGFVDLRAGSSSQRSHSSGKSGSKHESYHAPSKDHSVKGSELLSTSVIDHMGEERIEVDEYLEMMEDSQMR